jgi:hypothetical protein
VIARLICLIRGHDWLQVHVQQEAFDRVVRDFTQTRCSRCGRVRRTIEGAS